jgi:two-component system, sensor histidine kinase
MDDQEYKSLRGMRVLVVEDNIVGQRLIYYILLQWQASTDLAANGKIALELLSKEVYDVVLMDLMMPELDGYEATRAIRSWEGNYFQNLPIFAFSSCPDPEKIKRCGMNGLISKAPIIKEELYQKISPYLNSAEAR